MADQKIPLQDIPQDRLDEMEQKITAALEALQDCPELKPLWEIVWSAGASIESEQIYRAENAQ